MSAPDSEKTQTQRRRAQIEAAVKFWETWLSDMHGSWDGRTSQTFELTDKQKSFPKARYGDELPLPGMTATEVNSSSSFSTKM